METIAKGMSEVGLIDRYAPIKTFYRHEDMRPNRSSCRGSVRAAIPLNIGPSHACLSELGAVVHYSAVESLGKEIHIVTDASHSRCGVRNHFRWKPLPKGVSEVGLIDRYAPIKTFYRHEDMRPNRSSSRGSVRAAIAIDLHPTKARLSELGCLIHYFGHLMSWRRNRHCHPRQLQLARHLWSGPLTLALHSYS